MTDATPYTVPQEPGRWRATMLAALVHLALLAFLWIGVRWQNETPTTIEAEVWSPQLREAAPQPEPAAEPEKEPEPAPVMKETPREIPKVEEPPVVKPDIALEQEKKRKALEKKRLEEEQAKLKQKAEQERLAKLKKEQEERDRLAKLETEKQRLEKEKADKAKNAADAKRKQEADDKMLAKVRAEEMRRLAGGATGTGGSGEAPKSQGGRADSGYAGRVGAKIKSNIVFGAPEGLADNPPVEYEVNLLPDGSIAGIKKVKSSGIPGFDEAVRRAIEKSQPYPRDKSGSVPSSFIGSHRPKD